MVTVELNSNDFESPEILTQKELKILQSEIISSQTTKLWEKIKDNTKAQKNFIEERDQYLERSKNKTSKKRIQSLFNNVLKKYGIDEQSLSEVKNQDDQQIEKTQTTDDNWEKVSDQHPNDPIWVTNNKEWTDPQWPISKPQLGDSDPEKGKNWLETIMPNIQEMADDVEWEITKKIDFLEPISIWELLNSLFESMRENFKEEWGRMESNQEPLKKKIPEKQVEEILEFMKNFIQAIEKLCAEIKALISQENDQWPIITKDNYNNEKTIWKIIEYGKKIFKKIENNIDVSEFSKLSPPNFIETHEKKEETTQNLKQEKEKISLELEHKILEILYKMALSSHLSTKRIEKNPIYYLESSSISWK